MDSPSITVLLRDWATGSLAARDELMPLVYTDLKTLSRRLLRREHASDLTTTALVHDLYLKLARCENLDWNDRQHFFSFCARLMRQILTDGARARLAEKRDAMVESLAGIDEIPWFGQAPIAYLDLNDALDQLEATEPEKARVVEFRIYLGCTSEETAEILGLAKVTVDRHMRFAKAWLFQRLQPGTASTGAGASS